MVSDPSKECHLFRTSGEAEASPLLRPNLVHEALHVAGDRHGLAAGMVAHAVVLETKRDGFVRSLPGPNLTLSGRRLFRTNLTCRGRVQRCHDGRLGVSEVADALTSLPGFGNARGDVVHTARVLVLVPVLATGA